MKPIRDIILMKAPYTNATSERDSTTETENILLSLRSVSEMLEYILKQKFLKENLHRFKLVIYISGDYHNFSLHQKHKWCSSFSIELHRIQ